MGKYIQDTKWFKETMKAGVDALGKEWEKVLDEVIIRCVEGAASEKAKPPKAAPVALSIT